MSLRIQQRLRQRVRRRRLSRASLWGIAVGLWLSMVSLALTLLFATPLGQPGTGVGHLETALEVMQASGLALLFMAAVIPLAKLLTRRQSPTPPPDRQEPLLRPRAAGVARTLCCAYCHDDAERTATICPRCATVLHPECWQLVSTCPTLGCGIRPIRASRVRLEPAIMGLTRHPAAQRSQVTP